MAAAAALANRCSEFLNLIHELQAVHEQANPGNNTTLTACLNDLEQTTHELLQVPFSRLDHGNSCVRAFRALTCDVDANAQRMRLAWQRLPHQPSNSSIAGSQSGDDTRAQQRVQAQYLLSACTYGLYHFSCVLGSFLNSNGSSQREQSPTYNGNEARIRAIHLLHQFFRYGAPKPLRTQQKGTRERLPQSIQSTTASYDHHHMLLLQRFEQSYADAIHNERIPEVDKAVWRQRLIVYWSAQALDRFDDIMYIFENHNGPSNDPTSAARTRKYAYRYLMVTLRTLWLAQTELNDIGTAQSNPILYESSALCILTTCDNLYKFFNYNKYDWMREHLENFERHEFELQIPRLANTTPLSHNSSETSSASADPYDQRSAITGEPLQMISPELATSSIVPGYVVSPNMGFSMYPSAARTSHRANGSSVNGSSQYNNFGYPSGGSQSYGEPLMSGALPGPGLGIQSLQTQFNDMQLGSFSSPSHFGVPNISPLEPNPVVAPVDGKIPKWNEIQITEDGVHTPSTSVGKPFELGLRTIDPEPDFSSQWMASRTYVFRSSSGRGGSLRLYTTRTWNHGQPCSPHEIIHPLPGTEVVPHYAFQPLGNTKHILYMKWGGTQTGLTFMFLQTRSSDQEPIQELMAFQSALLGVTLELEYPVVSVQLKRSNSPVILLAPVRMQLWTDDHSWRTPCQTRQHQRNIETSPQMSSRRDRPIPLQDTFDDFEGSKLLIFADGSIYVILITNQIICEKVAPMRYRLSANKQVKGSSVRIRTIQGTSHAPAGIPLDQTGLGFDNLYEPSFVQHKYVEIHFDGGENIANEFVKDFHAKVKAWNERPSRLQQFRGDERKSRVQATSEFRRGGSRRH